MVGSVFDDHSASLDNFSPPVVAVSSRLTHTLGTVDEVPVLISLS